MKIGFTGTQKHQRFIAKLDLVNPNRKYKIIGKYINSKNKILLEDKYGKCLMTPSALLIGSKPSIQSAIDKNSYWINQAKEIHKNRYNYSLVEYKGSNIKVKIICKVHGEFEQLKYDHLNGMGCSKCANVLSTVNRSSTHEEFLKRLNKINQNKNFEIIGKYIKLNKKILVKNKYGFLSLTPASLLSGINPYIISAVNKTEYFTNQAKEIHNNKYDYSKVKYKNAKTKVIIICKEHGEFLQTADTHLRGSECKKCVAVNQGRSKNSFLNSCKNNNGILYIIKCWNQEEEFYKIGITGKTLSVRFSKSTLPYNYKSIIEFENNSEIIFDLEKELHENFLKFKYFPNIKFRGYMECFNLNEFQLETLKIKLKKYENCI